MRALTIFAHDQQKLADELQKAQQWTLPGNYTLALMVYAAVGLIVLGNWRNMNNSQRFFTFVFFPAHVVGAFVMRFVIDGGRGVADQDEVRRVGGFVVKVAAFILFIALLAYLAHGGR